MKKTQKQFQKEISTLSTSEFIELQKAFFEETLAREGLSPIDDGKSVVSSQEFSLYNHTAFNVEPINLDLFPTISPRNRYILERYNDGASTRTIATELRIRFPAEAINRTAVQGVINKAKDKTKE